MLNLKEIKKYSNEYKKQKSHFYVIENFEVQNLEDVYEVSVRAVYWNKEMRDEIVLGLLYIMHENSPHVRFQMGNAKLMKIKSQMEKEINKKVTHHRVRESIVELYVEGISIPYSEENIEYLDKKSYFVDVDSFRR